MFFTIFTSSSSSSSSTAHFFPQGRFFTYTHPVLSQKVKKVCFFAPKWSSSFEKTLRYLPKKKAQHFIMMIRRTFCAKCWWTADSASFPPIFFLDISCNIAQTIKSAGWASQTKSTCKPESLRIESPELRRPGLASLTSLFHREPPLG